MLNSYDWKTLLLFALLRVWLVLVTRCCFHSARWTVRPVTSPSPGTPPPLSTSTPSSLSGISWHRFREDISPPDFRLRGKCFVACLCMFNETRWGEITWCFLPHRVFGLSALTSGSLMILLSFVMKYAKTAVYIIRFVQGLFEVRSKSTKKFWKVLYRMLRPYRPCYLFQGMAIPALNGVLSAWSLTSEKSRMVTLTYCGNNRVWFIRLKGTPPFIYVTDFLPK